MCVVPGKVNPSLALIPIFLEMRMEWRSEEVQYNTREEPNAEIRWADSTRR